MPLFDKHNRLNIQASSTDYAYADFWLLHGYTECADSLNSIFNNAFLTSQFNIYAPDLPGFGASELKPKHKDLTEVTQTLLQTIRQYSSHRPIVLLGHSLGGIIATLLASQLTNRIIMFFNVEGLLVEDTVNARSLTRAHNFSNAKGYVDYMCTNLAEPAKNNRYIQRFINNIQASDPEILHAWAKSATRLLAHNRIKKLYSSLDCPTLYIQGERPLARLEAQYLAKYCDSHRYTTVKSTGHWPMLERPNQFWQLIASYLTSSV